MKLIREFCRRRLAARRWLAVGTARREHGFVVTVPPPLAAAVTGRMADATPARTVEPAASPAPSPSFAPFGH